MNFPHEQKIALEQNVSFVVNYVTYHVFGHYAAIQQDFFGEIMTGHADKEAKTHILLVDDDPEILESMRAALEANGYTVTTARDGSQGLALAERQDFDLLILDMMMPKRSGFLVLETLRQLEKRPTRIIMVTANEGNRHREYAEQLGVDEYLRKPFSMDMLLEAIKRVMNQ